MRERLHFMGNGYAGELLDLIVKGRSVYTLMNTYDFTVLKANLGQLSGVSLDKYDLTVTDTNGTFVTTINVQSNIPNGSMRFTEKYRTVAYLLFDGIEDNGYLLTENDERLLI
jgi:hypothetical protein